MSTRKKNRTEVLVRRAYGDPNDDEDQQDWQQAQINNKGDGNRVVSLKDVAAAPATSDPGSKGSGDNDDDGDDDEAAASSIAGSMGSSNANKPGKNGDDEELEKVKRMLTAGEEDKAVRRWRIVVIISLVLMGIAITTATCIFLMQHDESQYQAAYTVIIGNIEATTERRIKKLHGAFEQLTDIYTASAIADKMEWPYVTLTHDPFEVVARHARDEAGAELFTVAPFVTEAQRKEWIKYSFDNAWWFEQSKQVVEQMRGTGEDLTGKYINVSFGLDLFTFTGPSPVLNGTIPHVPAWQSSPPPLFPGVINVDFYGFDWFVPMYPALDRHREALITNVYDLSGASSLSRGPEEHQRYHQQFSSVPITVNDSFVHPHSIVITPISERLRDKTSKMVGILVATVAWDRYLSGLLPSESVTGIMVELVNNCNQSFTYMLNGTKSQYLGAENFQNRTFPDSRFVINLFDDSDHEDDVGINRHGDGKNYCDYSMVVYSTQEFKDSISTNTAVTFTVIVAAVSALVVITFLMYDCYVRRRNTKVVEAAVRSDQILMSHFPSNVRSRLYEAQQNQEKEANAARGLAAKSRLRHFLNGTETPAEAEDAGNMSPPSEVLGFEGKPIADLYVLVPLLSLT
jgi:hypothetical protein